MRAPVYCRKAPSLHGDVPIALEGLMSAAQCSVCLQGFNGLGALCLVCVHCMCFHACVCTCVYISECLFSFRPKEGCPAAPEEFSLTAFLVLSLCYCGLQRVCTCLYALVKTDPPQPNPTQSSVLQHRVSALVLWVFSYTGGYQR